MYGRGGLPKPDDTLTEPILVWVPAPSLDQREEGAIYTSTSP